MAAFPRRLASSRSLYILSEMSGLTSVSSSSVASTGSNDSCCANGESGEDAAGDGEGSKRFATNLGRMMLSQVFLHIAAHADRMLCCARGGRGHYPGRKIPGIDQGCILADAAPPFAPAAPLQQPSISLSGKWAGTGEMRVSPSRWGIHLPVVFQRRGADRWRCEIITRDLIDLALALAPTPKCQSRG